MAAQRFRGRGDERTAGRKRGENLREDLRTAEPFCFPARGSLRRPRLAQAHRSLRPHASTHGSRPRIPRTRTHRARLPRGRRNAPGQHPRHTDRPGAHRRNPTACLGSSIAPRIARSPRGRGRITFPPLGSGILLAHAHRAHPGARGWQRPGADRTDPALRRPPDRWLITFTAAFCAGIEFQTMSQFYLISQFSSLMRAVTATPRAGAFFFFP